MSAKKKADETSFDATAVVDPSPGGSLSDYVDFLHSIGIAAMLSRSGKTCWLSRQKRHLQRFPTECTDAPAPGETADLLAMRGIWMVNYLLKPGAGQPPNCYDYICRDPDYAVENLGKHARRDTRRGLRRFTVRLCTPEELSAHGYAAECETAERHGFARPPETFLRQYAHTHAASPFYDIWGAWQDAALAAFMTVIKVDDFAMVHLARSCSDALNDCPNNALCYAATRHLLVEEKRSYASYGLSTLQVQAHEIAMHKYKKRMGYEPVAMHRAFAVHSLLRPALTTKAGSWVLERVASLSPKRASLRKAAGLARLLSGRETEPLAWAEQDQDAESSG